MTKFDIKRFKKDTYKMEKQQLIQLYLWMHTDMPDNIGMSEREKVVVRKIVSEILTDKYDVTMGPVFGDIYGLR